MPSQAATVRIGLAFPVFAQLRQHRDGSSHGYVIPPAVVGLYAAWLRPGVICVLIR
jgi:hypothetical protein